MQRIRVALAIVLVVGGLLIVSGLRFVSGVQYVYSPPICGPLRNQFGEVAGDAGPCPAPPAVPPSTRDHWEWTPFWEAAP